MEDYPRQRDLLWAGNVWIRFATWDGLKIVNE